MGEPTCQARVTKASSSQRRNTIAAAATATCTSRMARDSMRMAATSCSEQWSRIMRSFLPAARSICSRTERYSSNSAPTTRIRRTKLSRNPRSHRVVITSGQSVSGSTPRTMV